MKKVDLGHCSLDGDYSVEKPRLRVADGGRLVEMHFARSPAKEWNSEQFGRHPSEISKRGQCKGFSFSSRRRMLGRINEESVNASMPCFVTLTFSDAVFRDDAAGFAKMAKLCIDTLFKRLRRVAPSACGFWRLEWQSRKSGEHEGKLVPHFHLMVWGLEWRDSAWLQGQGQEAFVRVVDRQVHMDLLGTMAAYKKDCSSKFEAGGDGFKVKGRRDIRASVSEKFLAREHQAEMRAVDDLCRHFGVESFMSFQDWASLAWYKIVGSGDLNHFTAGVRVERVKSWGGVMHYCAKYMAKADAQFLSAVPYGRNWGIFNRVALPWAKIVEIDLDSDVGVRLRRIARKMLERRVGRKWNAPYGITLYCLGSEFLRLIPSPPPPPPF
jgi:hypothetical protein